MKQIYVSGYFKGFKGLKDYSLLKGHPQEEIILKRLKIIRFFDKYGAAATKEAFSCSRSTVFLWKKKLKDSSGKLTSLAPLSKAPKTGRKRQANPKVIEFIRKYRTEHPGVGKETIKPELDSYLKEQKINSVSESTIGRIIGDLKEKNLIPVSSSNLSYNAREDRFKLKVTKKRKKLRRKGYLPEKPGDLVQLDTIVIFLAGIKRYILTAIDIKTSFAFAYCYNSLSSYRATDFLEKLTKVLPCEIKRIQTDNGSEFEKYFREYIEKQEIVHFHNYPKSPRSNANVERFNRTIQEQHVRWHEDELYDTEEFNKGLMEYLIWYNTKKPHRGLGRLPPLRYYLDNFIDDVQKSNMLWTLTINRRKRRLEI